MYRQAAGTMGRVLLAYAGIGAIGSGVGRTLLNAWDEMNPECYDNEEFDVLCYNNGNIEKERQKRISTFSKDDPLKIHFNAYQRNFGLVLSPISPDKSPFHRNLSIIEDGVPVEMNPHDFIYEGHVEGFNNTNEYFRRRDIRPNQKCFLYYAKGYHTFITNFHSRSYDEDMYNAFKG